VMGETSFSISKHFIKFLKRQLLNIPEMIFTWQLLTPRHPGGELPLESCSRTSKLLISISTLGCRRETSKRENWLKRKTSQHPVCSGGSTLEEDQADKNTTLRFGNGSRCLEDTDHVSLTLHYMVANSCHAHSSGLAPTWT